MLQLRRRAIKLLLALRVCYTLDVAQRIMSHRRQMPPQRTPILESPFALLALRPMIALLLLFLFLLLLLAAPLPQSVYLATTKMICECPFIFEIALAVAAPELCRGKWRHRWDGGVRLHV
jgi:hypothetical protein